MYDSVESLRDGSVEGGNKRKEVAENLDDAIGNLKGGFLEKAFGGSKTDD